MNDIGFAAERAPSDFAIPQNWTFETADVAAGFDRHVREQLPWYDLVTGAIAHIARHYIPARGGLVYDIGASTGNIGRALGETLRTRQTRLVSIERSAEMAKLYQGPQPENLYIADAVGFRYEPADLFVAFLVAMFIPVDHRREFFAELRRNVRRGGAVIVFDKTEAGAGYPATVLWRLALAGKLAAAVEPGEILAKELSLAGIQRPLDPLDIGAGAVEWFRFGDFAGYLVEADAA